MVLVRMADDYFIPLELTQIDWSRTFCQGKANIKKQNTLATGKLDTRAANLSGFLVND
jgi:hypothetical protein